MMAFITGALDKEIRLSFAQRIRGTLPDPYQVLISEGKEKDTPDFKYLSESKPIFCPLGNSIYLLTLTSDPLFQRREGAYAAHPQKDT